MLTDTQWAMLEPLVEQRRPKGKTPQQDLRRTVEAILWRHGNGAKWHAVPSELGPWWRAVATRYGKAASSFMGVLCLAAAIDWIKR